MVPYSLQALPNGPAGGTNHTLLVGDRQRPCIEIPKEYELRPLLGAEVRADANQLQISGRFIIIRSLASYLTLTVLIQPPTRS